MRIRRLTSVLLVGAASMLLIQPVNAQPLNSQPVSRVELRALLIRITELLDQSPTKSEQALRLRERIDALDAEAFEHLYRFSSNWQKLRIAVALMSNDRRSTQDTPETAFTAAGSTVMPLSAAGLPANLFATAYPVGSNYSTFRATLPGLGAMSDTPGSEPGLADERCDANFEAGVAIAAATFAFANIIAEVVCEALPELADIPCWIAQGVLQVAAEANNTVAAQCAIVDGAVDAAEIEAAYENTKAIFLNLDAHHLALQAHDADVKNGILNIIANNDAQTFTILNNDNANRDVIISNDNANTTSIINNSNTNKNELRDLMLRTQIEADLAAADSATPVALYVTPNANGGYLDLVQSIVTQTLANMQAAGASIGNNAQQFLNQANAQKAAGQFRAAYHSYRKAYKASTN
jgi:hypothetical protein